MLRGLWKRLVHTWHTYIQQPYPENVYTVYPQLPAYAQTPAFSKLQSAESVSASQNHAHIADRCSLGSQGAKETFFLEWERPGAGPPRNPDDLRG
jgi:hypothetical protein